MDSTDRLSDSIILTEIADRFKMITVNIILKRSAISHQGGLYNDALIIKNILDKPNIRCQIISGLDRDQGSEIYDYNIFLESIDHNIFNRAKCNLFIPNHEIYFYNFDFMLNKIKIKSLKKIYYD